jgi:hypothetical protein
LIYARTRHTTSRAGDPAHHDHILVTNCCEMLAGKGWVQGRAPQPCRRLLEGATMVGHLHAAAKARLLGTTSGTTGARPGPVVGRRGCGRAFVSPSPSAATRSPGIWSKVATSATGPSASPPGRPGHRNVRPDGMNCSRNERQDGGCRGASRPPRGCRPRRNAAGTVPLAESHRRCRRRCRRGARCPQGRGADSGDRRPGPRSQPCRWTVTTARRNAESPSGDGLCPPGARAGVQGVWPTCRRCATSLG